MTDIGEIKRLQKAFVKAREAGQDGTAILKEIADVRAKIAMEAEANELEKEINRRKALRDRTEAIKTKVQKQSEAIDRFLELRDKLIPQLQQLLEPLQELAKLAAPSWEREPGACYSGFGDRGQFASLVREIPTGYLPADFGCPFLEMRNGLQDAPNKPMEALNYFMWTYGILADFQKGICQIPLKQGEEFDSIEDETEGQNCLVCRHPKRGQIDKALKDGRPLRELESIFDISKSTLSRHRNICCNEGAIRVVD